MARTIDLSPTTPLTESPTVQALDPRLIKLLNTPAYSDKLGELALLGKEQTMLLGELNKRRGLFGLGRSMPRGQVDLYQKRIAAINTRIHEITGFAEILEAGFEPYTPPATWYVGYLWGERPPLPRGSSKAAFEFTAPLPPLALAKLEQAKKLGVFQNFLVASAYREHFRLTEAREPIRIYIDPVLIGTLDKAKTGKKSSYEPDANARFKQGFMIAQWDLAKELLLLPETASSGQ